MGRVGQDVLKNGAVSRCGQSDACKPLPSRLVLVRMLAWHGVNSLPLSAPQPTKEREKRQRMGPNYRISKTEDPPWQTLVWGARTLTRSVEIHQPSCQLSSPGVTAAAQPLRSAISKPVTYSFPRVISLTGLAIISPDGVQLGARRGPLWRELPKKASGEPEWSLDSRSR